MPSLPNPSWRWQRSQNDDSSGSRTSRVHTGLLQLSTGRSAAAHEVCTSAECCDSPRLRAACTWPRHCLLTAIHWLSVRWRVLFTLCCIMHSVLHETCPAYLTNTVELVSASRPRFGLPSASSTSTSTNYTAAVAPSLANVLAHTPIPH